MPCDGDHAPDARHPLRVDTGRGGPGAVGRTGDHMAPRIDHQGMAIGLPDLVSGRVKEPVWAAAQK